MRDIWTDLHTEGTIVKCHLQEKSGVVFRSENKGQVIRANKKDIEWVPRGVISKEERRAYLSGQTDLKIRRMESRIEEVELPSNPGSTEYLGKRASPPTFVLNLHPRLAYLVNPRVASRPDGVRKPSRGRGETIFARKQIYTAIREPVTGRSFHVLATATTMTTTTSTMRNSFHANELCLAFRTTPQMESLGVIT